jgi:ubiquinone/menaquinone biosynthesis C-methylase UbiE
MVDLTTLSPSERARQLGKPEGEVGVELGLRLNNVNNKITDHVYARLCLEAGMSVLEIGFGNGHLLPDLLRQSDDLKYMGIDISQTMIDEARQFNAVQVASGQAAFHLASAEDIPSDAARFDRVFAVNVIYFWADPLRPLQEICRVLHPKGVSVIAATTPATSAATDFQRPEFGFHPRDDATLVALHKQAGFTRVVVENYDELVSRPDGSPWARSYYLIIAQP